MNGLLVPGSVGMLTCILGRKLNQNGFHDIAFVAYAGAAVIGLFCVHDYRRRSDKDYKTNLTNQRSKTYKKSQEREISQFLEDIYKQNGNSISILKHPMMNQQLLMKLIQEGEEKLQRGDKLGSISKFSMAAAVSYIAGGDDKGVKLIGTISNMLPNVKDLLEKSYEEDRKAVDSFLESKDQLQSISREAFIQQLQQKAGAPIIQEVPRVEEVLEEDSIDEDSIDEGDEDGGTEGPIIEEIVEPEVAQPKVVVEPEVVVKPEVVAEQEVVVEPEVVAEPEVVVEAAPAPAEVSAEPAEVEAEPLEEAAASDAAELINDGFSTPEVLSGSDFNQPDENLQSLVDEEEEAENVEEVILETKELSVTPDQIVHDEPEMEPAEENAEIPAPVESQESIPEIIEAESEVEIVQTIIPGVVEEIILPDLSAGDVPQPDDLQPKAQLETSANQEIEDEELE